METIAVIRDLCAKNKTSIKALEKELGFSNGSLAKASTIKNERLQKIADYFNVTVDYLMTGEEKEEKHYSKEVLETADFLVQNDNLMALIECVKDDSDADLKRFLAILKAMKEK